MQVVKYTLVYIIVVALLASLIVLRKCYTQSCQMLVLTVVAAALFRDMITFNCTVCQNI